MADLGDISTCCVIAGGGPAGMMCGYLLARAGVDVIVLEKHKDFFRDFRGDTVHPSTLEAMAELGLLDEFLKLPHQEITTASIEIGGKTYQPVDTTHLPTRCKFIALMPQWDFLNFLAEKARAFPSFRLMMEADAVDLLRERGRISGVRVKTPDGPRDIRSDLVIGADGRHSTVREKAGLPLKEYGTPIDVLWMRIPRLDSDPAELLGRMAAGAFLVMIYRGDYWQCAYVIPKGGFDKIQKDGIENFRKRIAAIAGFAPERLDTLKSFDDVSLLTVTVNRLTRWARPGLLCIGDAAHAMSPIGGVGINLAVQDAIATANILSGVLGEGLPVLADLKKVQKRRQFPTWATQAAQVLAQNNIVAPTLAAAHDIQAPWILKLLNAVPYLRRFPARAIGMGVRPEHIHSPNKPS
jgi:2-polyprenyl-6-methoxyphenol hydroxylase-like FAD-dependent oxidoreductase